VVFLGLFLYLRKGYMQKSDGILAHTYSAWGVLCMPLVFIVASLVYLTLSVDFGMLQGGRLVLPGAGGLGIATTAAIKAAIRRSVARRSTGALVVLGMILANLAVLSMTAYYYSVI
jgi:predicted MFS family arabinose efflux permease